MHGVRVIASWGLGLFLAVMYLWIADATLFPREVARNVIFPQLAQDSGIDFFEPTGRLAVGVMEILAALLLLLPWTRRIGAILGALIGLGAVAAHVLWLGIEIPAAVNSDVTDGGQVFYLAVALTVASVLLVFLHPGKNSEKPLKASYYGREAGAGPDL